VQLRWQLAYPDLPGEWQLKWHVPVADLTDMRCRRRLIVYPLKMSELNHPTLLEAIGMSTEFKTSYVKSHVGGSPDTMTWVGYVHSFTDALILLLLLLLLLSVSI